MRSVRDEWPGRGEQWVRNGKKNIGFPMDRCVQKKGTGERESDSWSQRPTVTDRASVAGATKQQQGSQKAVQQQASAFQDKSSQF
eukprot:892696-Pelagomonas_calceolata.AAC.7